MRSKNSKVIIIAAGPGSRLRPLTNNKPKCLLEIKKKSLLSHQIDVFKKSSSLHTIYPKYSL